MGNHSTVGRDPCPCFIKYAYSEHSKSELNDNVTLFLGSHSNMPLEKQAALFSNMPKEKYTPEPNQPQKSESIDEQVAFAEQYFLEEQQHWLDSYGGDTEGQPPTRGGKTVKTTKPVSIPKPRPAPVNNPQ
ncbi:hypothetical protein F4803DRAFT_528876 [Xylaria telfairii]|nr:hypothetical protein F4803DRAFT_528876 [Xylaria telfairii]